MARKQAKGRKMAPTETEAATKPVRLDLRPEVHRMLRLVAADEGVPMASYARAALEAHLRGEVKARGLRP